MPTYIQIGNHRVSRQQQENSSIQIESATKVVTDIVTAGNHIIPNGINYVQIDATAGNITIDLPPVGGEIFETTFKRLDNSVNTITFNDTIDGQANRTLDQQGSALTIYNASGVYNILA